MSFIFHLSSVHPRNDTRIYYKMCRSLADLDKYSVFLLVSDLKGSCFTHNISIIDLSFFHAKLSRLFFTFSAFIFFITKFKRRKSSIVHIHDPELLILSLLLHLLGFKVVYDSHEDFFCQLSSKSYLNSSQKLVLSFFFYSLFKTILPHLSGIVAATNHINHSLIRFNDNIVTIFNYPILSDFSDSSDSTNFELPPHPYVLYVGSISANRGVFSLLESLDYLDSQIHIYIAGSFATKEFEDYFNSNFRDPRIHFIGYLSRDSVSFYCKNALCGLVLLHPTPSYVQSLPVKLFEYMSAGIPIISSNFPLWTNLMMNPDIGFMVDPHSPSEIASSINLIFRDTRTAQTFARNSLKKSSIFNWSSEFNKLLSFYDYILTTT